MNLIPDISRAEFEDIKSNINYNDKLAAIVGPALRRKMNKEKLPPDVQSVALVTITEYHNKDAFDCLKRGHPTDSVHRKIAAAKKKKLKLGNEIRPPIAELAEALAAYQNARVSVYDDNSEQVRLGKLASSIVAQLLEAARAHMAHY